MSRTKTRLSGMNRDDLKIETKGSQQDLSKFHARANFRASPTLRRTMLSSNEELDNREKVKPSEHRFADNGEQMFEVATRCKGKWIDAFFLYSMIWAFGSILTENAKREFSNWLKKILKEKDDERIANERRARYKDSDAGS